MPIKKYKFMIAGLPTQVSEEGIKDMQGNLVDRAKRYFGKLWNRSKQFRLYSALYIDNYVALNKIEDEEFRREMAWEFTKNAMNLDEAALRPDHYSTDDVIMYLNEAQRVALSKLLDKHPNGWCHIRYAMALESDQGWTLESFFTMVIVENRIGYKTDRYYSGRPIIEINLFQFAEFYYCKKWGISYEHLDI